ncbi:hypothetical protein CBS147337_10017 [Penicillium roqueforti]|nr:hypothetical protein CBS147337_10017 [Penicillium roqueforti]
MEVKLDWLSPAPHAQSTPSYIEHASSTVGLHQSLMPPASDQHQPVDLGGVCPRGSAVCSAHLPCPECLSVRKIDHSRHADQAGMLGPCHRTVSSIWGEFESTVNQRLIEIVAKQAHQTLERELRARQVNFRIDSLVSIWQGLLSSLSARHCERLLVEWGDVMGKPKGARYVTKPPWWPRDQVFMPVKGLSVEADWQIGDQCCRSCFAELTGGRSTLDGYTACFPTPGSEHLMNDW